MKALSSIEYYVEVGASLRLDYEQGRYGKGIQLGPPRLATTIKLTLLSTSHPTLFLLLDVTKQVMIRLGRQMVFDEVSSDQLAARDQSTQITFDEASGDQPAAMDQPIIDEVSSDQLAAMDHLTLQEEDIGDTIVLNPLPGRTSMATESEVPEVSEDATQSEELGVGLEREPRNNTPLTTESRMLGASEDAVGSREPGVGSESSESGYLTIHLAQPIEQPRGREQQSAPPPEPGRSSQRARKAPNRFGWLSIALTALAKDLEDPGGSVA